MKKSLILYIFISIFFLACSSKDNLIITSKNEKYGVFSSKENKFIIKPIFNQISFIDSINDNDFNWFENRNSNKYFLYEYNNYFGVVSLNEVIYRPIFKKISKFYNKFAVVQENDKFGYIDENLNLVQKPIFKDARDFLFDVSFVQSFSNDKYACIDKNMNLLTDFLYDEIYSFSNGFVRFKKDNKWGFLNNKCEEVILAKHDFVYDFIDGVAKVIDGEKIYFLKQDRLK
ncbi:WG repeat protein [Malaciobacter marinus]|jgi:hypothetical protein|uniref:WG repeat protein n=1 Tax=Malaciobacter marinus TaxID=505249 RepID=A0AB36ZYE6_9BACT|nr:WG repeat-containing protein [Malaciobacter marinus]PPK60582.1 WG repeat protein [Malaciobacter marinus]